MGRRPIKQFVIGRDFTAQEIELLILKLAKWFRSDDCDRRHDDPEAAAKEVVEQCLNAVTKKGDPWKNAPDDFATRVKVKAAYDMLTDKGIKISPVKHPDAVRRLDSKAAENGDKINDMRPTAIDFDIEGYRDEAEARLVDSFPELNNPVMLPHVRRVSLLYAQQELLDRELLLTTSPMKREAALRQIEVLNKTLDSVLKILDIHPESLRKRLKDTDNGSIGALVAVLEADDTFREREKLWAKQAALQFWYMSQHPNGRGDGPQLSEWEVWHMTRSLPVSFTCKCGRHYPSIIRGFTPKDLKKYLVEQGVLIHKPVLPKLMPTESLDGISEYIDSLPDVDEAS